MASYSDIMLGRLFVARGQVPAAVVAQCLAGTTEQRSLAQVLVVRGLLTQRAAHYLQRLVAHMQFMRGEMLFARLLVQRGLATPQVVRAALETQKQLAYRERIGQILVQRGLLRVEQMEAVVDAQLMALAEDAMRIEAEGLDAPGTPQQVVADLAAPPALSPPPVVAPVRTPPRVWPPQRAPQGRPQGRPHLDADAIHTQLDRPAARLPSNLQDVRSTEKFSIPEIPDQPIPEPPPPRRPAPEPEPSTSEMAAAAMDSLFDDPASDLEADADEVGTLDDLSPMRTLFVDSAAIAAQPARPGAAEPGPDSFSPEHTLPVDSEAFASGLPRFKQTDEGLDLAEMTAELRRPLAEAPAEPELRPGRILRAFDSSLLISGLDGMLERHDPKPGQAESKPIRVVPEARLGAFKAPLVPRIDCMDHFQLADGSVWRVVNCKVFRVKGVDCYLQLECEDLGELEEGLHQSWDGKIPGMNG